MLRAAYFRFVATVIVAITCAACRSAPKQEAKQPQVGWRSIGSWSGQGNTQTDSFNIESTQWRIKWETTGAGAFTLVVHSAVSGRPILAAVDHNGAGKGIAYVTEDPRLYHLVIESSSVDWSIQVEEAVVGYPL